ncbi:hypothetical protein NIE88_04015 [Sporolactobacillus shoreicorticis]|uniref:Transposase n=1 Tax=Sporolactobacillus shoreicorticis TaxID=1923877 RepID=A0ABW5RYT6_9BACL|nr:hypothetical protein [Sporolactobacillus shoreicorticis]MCO7124941.1 hypothetical protein [Sporolactobacillus shoreicorticis]
MGPESTRLQGLKQRITSVENSVHRQRLLARPAVRELVQGLILNHQWSPEQIDARLKVDHSRW